MKNILVFVCILFSVVSSAVKIEIPGPEGVNSHKNRPKNTVKPGCCRNLFGTERDPQRLEKLKEENRRHEAKAAERFLVNFNPDDYEWSLVAGDADEDVEEIFREFNRIASEPRHGEQFEQSGDEIKELKSNFEDLCAIGISPLQVKCFCDDVGGLIEAGRLSDMPKPTNKEELEDIFQRLNLSGDNGDKE